MTQQEHAVELTRRAISICERRIELRDRRILALRSVASALAILLEVEADQAEFERQASALDLKQHQANLTALESRVVVASQGVRGMA